MILYIVELDYAFSNNFPARLLLLFMTFTSKLVVVLVGDEGEKLTERYSGADSTKPESIISCKLIDSQIDKKTRRLERRRNRNAHRGR